MNKEPLFLHEILPEPGNSAPLWNIRAGVSTIVVFSDSRPGGEPDEVRAVLEGIQSVKQLAEQYMSSSLEELKEEYRAINGDFTRRMKEESRLQAIRVVLVEQYNMDAQNLADLE